MTTVERAPRAEPSSTAAVLARLQAIDRRRLVTALHWATLVAAFGFLVYATRDQWFDSDEWNFLARRRLVGSDEFAGIWEAHNRHWVTLPVLLYRFLFSVFGVSTYAPYLVVLLVLHLGVAHLLWRLMLRFHVDDVLATVAAAIYALAGAGWENVTNGFQISLVGSLFFGLAAVLVVHDRDLSRRQYAFVWILLLASLMCSGIGVTLVAVVVVIVLLRGGIRPALIVGSVPTAAYLLWYALQGQHAPASAGEQPLSTALQATPAFLWRGLTSAVDAQTRFEGVGAVVVVLLVVWILRHTNLSDSAWRDSTVLALGAALSLCLTALGRSGLGTDNATAPRYAYVTLALLVPLVALALDRLLGTGAVRAVVIVLGVGFLAVAAGATVVSNANAAGIREQEQERRVLAAAELTRRDPQFLETIVVPIYMPDLDIDAIRRLDDEGKLPGDVRLTEEDILTARVFLQLRVAEGELSVAPALRGEARVVSAEGASATPEPGEPGCARVVPESDNPSVVLDFDRPGTATIRTERSGSIAARVEDDRGATSRPRTFPTASNQTQRVEFSGSGNLLRLEVPAVGTTSICRLSDA